jgi:formamidopyrimidine-DNA glycosylase
VIKSVLLDQKNIAGIGNVYVQDILFAARLYPLRKIPPHPSTCEQRDGFTRLHDRTRQTTATTLTPGCARQLSSM